jgi:hypothetical protein
MPTYRVLLGGTLVLALLCGCGGSTRRGGRGGDVDEPTEEELRLTADDVEPRARLKRAELTLEVDERRYRAIAPARSEFEPNEHPIYFVGILKDVPTDSTIEVRWFKDSSPEPMLARDVQGSEKYEFISSLEPPGQEFVPGTYTVRVYVKGQEVGSEPFTILGDDPFTTGTKLQRLKLSSKVSSGMKPKNPRQRFKKGTSRVHATFDVKNAPSGTHVTARWLRNGATFHEEELDIPSDGRFGAQIFSGTGLPEGSYQVLLEWDDGGPLKSSFTVGNSAAGPSIDTVAIGHELGDDNMPVEEITDFSRNDEAVLLGLRFLDLEPGSVITIEWTRVEEDGDSLYHTTRTPIPNGGSGTLGAMWQPTTSFEPGEYKAVIIVGEETLAEAPFTIR